MKLQNHKKQRQNFRRESLYKQRKIYKRIKNEILNDIKEIQKDQKMIGYDEQNYNKIFFKS